MVPVRGALGRGRIERGFFWETYRVSAYDASGLVQLASLVGPFVPHIGPLLALGLAVCVSVLGTKGAHETTTTARAVVSAMLPTILGLLLLLSLAAGLLFFPDSRGIFDKASGTPQSPCLRDPSRSFDRQRPPGS